MRRKRHYKEVVRGTMISLRLTQEEHLRLQMAALRERTSVSGLMRRGVAGLIEGAAAEATTAAAATTAAVASPVTPDVEAIPAADAVAPSAAEATPTATAATQAATPSETRTMAVAAAGQSV